MNLIDMKEKCHRLQWSLDDIDWDAPGKENITQDQALSLKGFMTFILSIESLAASAFNAMRVHTTDPELNAILASFAGDERRHADAQRALMVRWGIAKKDEVLKPNVNVEALTHALEGYPRKIHPSVAWALIPVPELVLDGACVRHLTQMVNDPLCHTILEKINADEARHLAIDLYMLEKYSHEYSFIKNAFNLFNGVRKPRGIYTLLLGYIPMLHRSKRYFEDIHLDTGEVHECLQRYVGWGERDPYISRHPTYKGMQMYTRRLIKGQHGFGDFLVRISDLVEGMSNRFRQGT